MVAVIASQRSWRANKQPGASSLFHDGVHLNLSKMKFLNMEFPAALIVSSFLDDESIYFIDSVRFCGDSHSVQIETFIASCAHETRGTMLLSTPGSHITPPGPVLHLPYHISESWPQYHPSWPQAAPSITPTGRSLMLPFPHISARTAPLAAA